MVDLDGDAGGAQLFEVSGLQAWRHPGLLEALISQHPGGEPRPRGVLAVVDIPCLGEPELARGLALDASPVDLERAGYQHVIRLVKPDIETGLHGKPRRVG